MKKGMSPILLLGLCLLTAAGCADSPAVTPPKDVNYDPATRVATDAGEIAYSVEPRETYYNFIEVYDDHGQIYRVGDPFVMRFDGKYYMYSSVATRAGTENLDGKIMVWSSDNLIDWKWEAVACEDMEGHVNNSTTEQEAQQEKNGATYVAYAPEVIYYRGYFYMCESQFSKGHFLFRADSPIGPFKRISTNQGHGIDGSFYAGEDGELYMVHLDSALLGLAYTKVNLSGETATLETQSTPVENASLNGWTEGPHWFGRNGYKYLTYTGTNVRCASYKVGWSYTTGDLLTELIQPEDHIALLTTDTPYTPASGYNADTGKYIGYNSQEGNIAPPVWSGLGHSSNVIAPNLDGVYTAYHNEYTVSGNKFDRRLNIDQYFTNDSLLHVNGLGVYDKQKPARPDYETYGDEELLSEGGFFLSPYATGAVFTAEYNFKNPTSSPSEVVLGYKNSGNYAHIVIEKGEMRYAKVENGTERIIAKKALDPLNDYTRLNVLRVENGYGKAMFYYNGIHVFTVKEPSAAGKIGYGEGLTVGSTAYSNDAFGSSDFEAVKNLPSEFPAYTYLKGAGRGFSLAAGKADRNGVRQGEKETTRKVYDAETGEDFTSVVLGAGDWVKYPVNASTGGVYALGVRVSEASKGTVFEAIVDGERIYKMTIPADTDFNGREFAYVNAGYLDFGEAGYHTLKIRVFAGTLDIASLRPESASSEKQEITYTFSPDMAAEENVQKNVVRKNGFFRITNKGLRTDNNDTAVFVLAESGRSDVDVSVNIRLNSISDTGGLFIRMKNYAYPMFSYATTEVSSSFQGYYVRFDRRAVTLMRYNYGSRTCAQKLFPSGSELAPGEVRALRVLAEGNRIRVYVGGELMIDYSDYNAFLSGATGIYAENSRIYYTDFSYREIG